MRKIGIFYGSTTYCTEDAAHKIGGYLSNADIRNISSSSVDEIKEYDTVILGSSTWGTGDLQDDWENVLGELAGVDLGGKKVAFFGTGNQRAFPDTFADALGILYEALENSGAEFIGAWPIEGYEYAGSRAERNGVFIGLALDDDNQANLTDERIRTWVSSLEAEITDSQ